VILKHWFDLGFAKAKQIAFDDKFYFALFMLIGKSPLSRFKIPIDVPYSAMMLFFALFVGTLLIKRPKLDIPKTGLFMLSLLVYLILSFSFLQSDFPTYALETIVLPNLMIFTGILLFTFFSIKSKADFEDTLFYMFLLSLGLMVLGALSIVTSQNIRRLAVLGGGPNVYYRFMLQGAVIASYFAIVKKWRIIAILSLLIMIVFAFLTGSKGAMVTLIITGVSLAVFYILVVMKEFSWKRLGMIVAIVLAVVLVSAVVLDVFGNVRTINRMLSVLDIERLLRQNTFNTRLSFIKTGVDMLMQRPIFGYGAGGFYHYSLNLGVIISYPHNIIVELFSEHGLVGGVTFMMLLLLFIAQTLKTLTHSKATFQSLSLLVTCIGLFVMYFTAAQMSGDLVDSRAVFWLILMIDRMLVMLKTVVV
jgi:O-antigen ligase